MADSKDNIEIMNPNKPSIAAPRKFEIVYWNIIAFTYYHLAGFYGLYLTFTAAKWQTVLLTLLTYFLGAIGVILGGHRLWSHNSFKARKPLQMFLMLCHTIANQHSVIHWVRDHRLHHKYSDTDADPHNASRGFFFSHVGWLLVKKHPEVKKRGKTIDISDVTSNPILKFQHDNNFWFIPLVSFVIPTLIPMYYWGETLSCAWHLNMFRYIVNLNFTFMINSVAHLWGDRPVDKNIAPAGNLVTFYCTFGEGFHNYHHVFPWDYKSAEIGCLDIMTKVIDFFWTLGLAYDLKTVSKDMLKARAERTGDGSFRF